MGLSHCYWRSGKRILRLNSIAFSHVKRRQITGVVHRRFSIAPFWNRRILLFTSAEITTKMYDGAQQIHGQPCGHSSGCLPGIPRSGTEATINYARKMSREIIIIDPSARQLTHENQLLTLHQYERDRTSDAAHPGSCSYTFNLLQIFPMGSNDFLIPIEALFTAALHGAVSSIVFVYINISVPLAHFSCGC